VPYNDTIDEALQYLETTIDATSHPTVTQATVMWGAVYDRMLTFLAAHGVTVAAGTASEDIVKDVEAMFTSCKVGRANDLQSAGEVQQYTEWLCDEAQERLEELAGYEFAEAAGATVTRKGPRPRSLATDYPNSDLDTSDIESPLPSRKLDSDL